jgi:hypothetical protein
MNKLRGFWKRAPDRGTRFTAWTQSTPDALALQVVLLTQSSATRVFVLRDRRLSAAPH